MLTDTDRVPSRPSFIGTEGASARPFPAGPGLINH